MNAHQKDLWLATLGLMQRILRCCTHIYTDTLWRAPREEHPESIAEELQTLRKHVEAIEVDEPICGVAHPNRLLLCELIKGHEGNHLTTNDEGAVAAEWSP